MCCNFWATAIWNQCITQYLHHYSLSLNGNLGGLQGYSSHSLGKSNQPIREGDGTPLQDSRLENPMDGGAWRGAVHGVAECRTWLSNFTFTFHFPALEKEMATHFIVLAWRIPGMGEPGGLLSMRSHRVGHDWSDLAAAAQSKMVPTTVANINSIPQFWDSRTEQRN